MVDRERNKRDRAQSDASSRRIDLTISRVLRFGILLSVVALALGTFGYTLSLYLSGNPGTIDEVLRSGRAAFSSPGQVTDSLLRMEPLGLQYVGLSILTFLPVVPIALSLFGYLAQRDRPFVAITTFLLAVLGSSLMLGVLG